MAISFVTYKYGHSPGMSGVVYPCSSITTNVGDVVLFALAQVHNQLSTPPSIGAQPSSVPMTWLRSQLIGNWDYHLYYRVVSDYDSGRNYSFYSNTPYWYGLLAYAGANPATPIGAHSTNTSAANSSSVFSPAVTAPYDGLVVRMCFVRPPEGSDTIAERVWWSDWSYVSPTGLELRPSMDTDQPVFLADIPVRGGTTFSAKSGSISYWDEVTETRIALTTAEKNTFSIALSQRETIARYETAGTYTWTRPTGVSSVSVQCWGAGGGGVYGKEFGSYKGAGGGGGGGAYAASTLSVVDASYPVIVGAGGDYAYPRSEAPTPPGGDSSFNATGVLAKGGAGATLVARGAGGSSASSIGTVKYSGGAGSANGGGSNGGSGGGSAGTASAGPAATGSYLPAAEVVGGGSGGFGGQAGSHPVQQPTVGASPGGGGGGGSSDEDTKYIPFDGQYITYNGKDGADGAVLITYNAPIAPMVSTNTVTSVGANSAVGGGNATDDGGSAITEKGICWNTVGTPTITNSKAVMGTGEGTFSAAFYGLVQGTHYYLRAYATNAVGTSYGYQVEFTTIYAYSAPEPVPIVANVSCVGTYRITLSETIVPADSIWVVVGIPPEIIPVVDGLGTRTNSTKADALAIGDSLATSYGAPLTMQSIPIAAAMTYLIKPSPAETIPIQVGLEVTSVNLFPAERLIVWNPLGEYLGTLVGEIAWVDNLESPDELEVLLPQFFIDERGRQWSKWEMIQGQFYLGWRGKRYQIYARLRGLDGQSCRAYTVEVELATYYTNETPTVVLFQNELPSDICETLLLGRVPVFVRNSSFSTRVENPIDHSDEPQNWVSSTFDGYEDVSLKRFVWRLANGSGRSDFIRFSPRVHYRVKLHGWKSVGATGTVQVGVEWCDVGEEPGQGTLALQSYSLAAQPNGEFWLETDELVPTISDIGDLYIWIQVSSLSGTLYAMDARLQEIGRDTGWSYVLGSPDIDVRPGILYADSSEFYCIGTWDIDYSDDTRTSTTVWDQLVYNFNSTWISVFFKASGTPGSTVQIYVNDELKVDDFDVSVAGSYMIIGIDPAVDQFLSVRVKTGKAKVWKIEQDTNNVYSFRFEGASILEALSTVLKATGGVFQFDSYSRTLTHYSTYGTDHTAATGGVVFEEGKNITEISLNEEYSNVVNRLRVNGYGEGPFQMITTVDATGRRRLGEYVEHSPTLADDVLGVGETTAYHTLYSDGTLTGRPLVDNDAFYPGDTVGYSFAYQFNAAAVAAGAEVTLYFFYGQATGSIWGLPHIVDGSGNWLSYTWSSVTAVDTDKHLFLVEGEPVPANVPKVVLAQVACTGSSGSVTVENMTAVSRTYRASVTSQERYGELCGTLDIPEVDSLPVARRTGSVAVELAAWPTQSFNLTVEDLEEYGEFFPGDYVPVKVWGEFFFLRILAIAKSTSQPNVATLTVSSRQQSVFADWANVERKVNILSRSFQGTPSSENIPFFYVPFQTVAGPDETPAEIPFYLEDGAFLMDLRLRYRTGPLISTTATALSGGEQPSGIGGGGTTSEEGGAFSEVYSKADALSPAGEGITGTSEKTILPEPTTLDVKTIPSVTRSPTTATSVDIKINPTDRTTEYIYFHVGNFTGSSGTFTCAVWTGAGGTGTRIDTSSQVIANQDYQNVAITTTGYSSLVLYARITSSVAGTWLCTATRYGFSTHTHVVTGHTHTTNTHSHTVPAHSHTVTIDDHQHAVGSHSHDLPNHTHIPTYGIYTGPSPTALIVRLDDTIVVTGSDWLDADNLDLMPYVSKDNNGRPRSGWHTVQFAASTVGESGCVNGTVFIRKFLTTKDTT